MIDYHVHSTYSGDAKAGLREMCARAVAIGLADIAFTEHIDFAPTAWSNTAFSYRPWMDEIAAAREEFAGRLIIRAAAEVDYQPEYHDQVVEFLESHRFDYILGAVHYVDGVIMEEHERCFSGKSQRDAYMPYFEVAAAAVETGLFHALAHLDLCKRYGVLYYGPFHPEQLRPELQTLLGAAIRRGVALEINTSGLRQEPREPYPGLELLRIYSEFGGRLVTLGSDAHQVHQLGGGLDRALAMVEEAGLTIWHVADTAHCA